MQKRGLLALIILLSTICIPTFGVEPFTLDGVKGGSVESITLADDDASRSADSLLSRGLVDLQNIFLPQGVWSVGGAVSYSTHVNDNYQFLVVNGIDSEGYTFNVSPMFTYTYANNRAVGARFVYGRSLLKIDSAALSFGDDQSGINIGLEDFYSLKHSITAQAILRQYIPVGSNKRFALFNEVQLGIGGSQSKFAYDYPVTGTYATSQEYSLGLAPGVMAFASNRVVVEISVGVLGLSYQKVKQVHNQVTVGETTSGTANFKVNLLSIGFGIGFYI